MENQGAESDAPAGSGPGGSVSPGLLPGVNLIRASSTTGSQEDDSIRWTTPRPRSMRTAIFVSSLVLLLGGQFCLAERPNILFAIADDWGAHAGAYGTSWVKTPAFDRVAREGVLFRNAYTPVAKCAPSRAIVLTGRHAWQNEEAGNHMAYFPAKLKSWPEVLTEAGWHMGITGKGWGPGIAKDAGGRPRQMTGRPFSSRKAAPPTKSISNNDYAANFVDFLDARPRGAPWCFWYGSTEPHRDYEFQSGVTKGGKQLSDIPRVPDYWPDEETVRHDMLDYAFEVEHTDSHLARMIAELEKRNLLDSTLVIVTSDHGMPFPRVKGYAYRHSNHVPLAIRWPAGIRHPGRVVDDFVDFTDIAATVLDYAGIDPAKSGMQPLTGSSWRPILESAKSGRVVESRDHVLVGKERTDVGRPQDWGYPIRGIVTDSHLLLYNYEPSRWPAGNPETGYLDTDGSPTKSLILERGRADRADRYWQLNFGLRPAAELYDLRLDPDCAKNIAAAEAGERTAETLRARMEAELKAQGDPRMSGRGRVFDEYKPTAGEGFYEKFMRGEKPPAGWVNKSDFEAGPIKSP
jgi:N-sulfoglucosamine sulfohydrolase